MGLVIWLVRHGETESNAAGVFQGHIDTHLNDRGISQARATGRQLANVPFRRAYASDLQRAARTAELILEGRDLAVVLDPDLREMHYGVLQGTPWASAGELLSTHGMADVWNDGSFARRGMAAPGGESVRQMRHRARRFVQRLQTEAAIDGDEHVLVVAHGGQLRVLLTTLLELPPQARSCFSWDNCAVSRVAFGGDRPHLEMHNATFWKEDAFSRHG